MSSPTISAARRLSYSDRLVGGDGPAQTAEHVAPTLPVLARRVWGQSWQGVSSAQLLLIVNLDELLAASARVGDVELRGGKRRGVRGVERQLG